MVGLRVSRERSSGSVYNRAVNPSPAAGLPQRFEARFGDIPRVFRAPGRVNLIGEHTDYNYGFVMPAAIQFYCWVAASARDDSKLVIHSENLNEGVTVDLDDALPSGKWSDYPVGAAVIPHRSGKRLKGANLLIHSDVPIGAGLSSSAAIEVSVALAMLSLSGHEVHRKQLALWCQRAENEFAGMRCGIMDQFVACHGQQGHALKLDCRSLDYELVPLPTGVEIVICNTMVKHKLAGGEYNIRRAQCEEGVHLLAAVLPSIKALRDISSSQLERHRELPNPVVYRRCRHVVTEDERVQLAASALNSGSVSSFGRLMDESHESLRQDYEVSCTELDQMVELARKQRGVLGARMTGGGFGGCTVNLVRTEDALSFQENVTDAYRKATGLVPEIYVCRASEGAGEIGLALLTEAETPTR
jgi:galactokinase